MLVLIMPNFNEKVLILVNQIPKGKVASYGQIAAALGSPRAARQVGWAMHSLEGNDAPWWRVVNSKGYLSIRGNDLATKDLQKQLLEKEGVEVDTNYNLNIEKYGIKNFSFR